MDAIDNEASSSHRRRVVAILGLVAFAVVLGAVLAYAYGSGERGTDDAYVTGHVHTIAARVNGTVEQVLVRDNQFVHAGDKLVRLDTRDFDVRVALERSRIEQAQAEQAKARALIAQSKAAIVAAVADSRRGDLDFARAQELTRETPRGLSQQEYDAADATRKSAAARVLQAQAQLALSEATLASSMATETQGRANLRDASLQLNYTDVVSPVDGFVGKKTVETGQRIVPGQALLAVVEKDAWVVANFRETQLKHVRVGDSVSLRFDALPDLLLKGHVESFAPATGAQFALLPPDNATGNFTKVVQRVPVKILIDDPDIERRHIALGMSVTVRLSARGESS
ncbi:HlyD family secretion protein [Paraburkholderia sp. BL25I1N1]|uniref:HlyD family secretion protein n=1 Tax=Paraburkholderia sp. BL25I1N1 TaxID=1938804 RepID=UPI000D444C6E|nr:HlyD family secretion protein [Paraburkholderia sp. BL25I1N1]PRY04451.1 membrane fusion protein (multidrug efflux system) [Paraburkholderia sp. BL25I1N1]